ncbi:type II toxin-antitoxin system HicA family toxin [Verrucomicrobium sp. BvORR106]|uniref:type II toxin-antitoxin system HicA family toxin n=1 Tax=Verrucomicrobium sp. BvORR106 TaxID=1403819 RepID=UPI0009DEBD3F|nr:type II toxin-antitoxin system HicA family toxin [Verrucomicrobium sp. BvORR106]
MKAKEVVARLKADDWTLKATKGSHAQYVHPVKPGKVTVPQHGGKDIATGTLRSIFRQAGWPWPP